MQFRNHRLNHDLSLRNIFFMNLNTFLYNNEQNLLNVLYRYLEEALYDDSHVM